MRIRTPLVRIVVVALIVGGAVFLGRSRLTRSVRRASVENAVPLMVSVRGASNWIVDRISALSGWRRSAWERERSRLLAEIAARESLRSENAALREALTLRESGEVGVIPASVAAFLREGRDEFLILDRGTADGVGIGDVVIDRNRVLGGTVVAVGERVSRALLVTSASRSTDVVVAGTELRAIARGNNAREFIVELVPKDAPLVPGDLLVASSRAAGGRSGLLVGEVRDVATAEHETFKRVRATHRFDVAADTVLVLLAP